MAGLFQDSVAHYTNPVHKYSSNNLATVQAGGGRNSGSSIRCATNGRFVQRNLSAAKTTGIFGVAVRREDMTGDGAFIQIRDNTNLQFSVNSHTNGSLSVVGPGGTLGTSSPGLISGGVYSFIEIKFTIHDSTGSVTLRRNGITLLTLTNQDIQAGAAATFDNFRLISPGGVFDFCDVYLCDNLGGVHDDFLGDVRSVYLPAASAGSSTQWTPSAGSNFQNVDDAAPDDDTTYNAATLVGAVDLYTLANLSGSPTTVFFVQGINRAREDDAGGHQVRGKLRAGTTTDDGADVSVGASYETILDIWDTNPDTTVAWDAADFPVEYGIELVS